MGLISKSISYPVILNEMIKDILRLTGRTGMLL